MNIKKSISIGHCNVSFSGTFTFSDTMAFSEVIALIQDPGITQFTIHIDALEFVDSSGLGMFLLARDAAQQHQKTLILKGMHGQVKKIFELACFQQYFTLVEA